jgi:hypothetical protein
VFSAPVLRRSGIAVAKAAKAEVVISTGIPAMGQVFVAKADEDESTRRVSTLLSW